MDITIAREMVTQQASSGQTRPSVSASVSEEPLQSPNPGNATVKSKADVLGTPKASTFPTEMGEEDEITTFYAKPNEKTAKNTAKNAKAPEKEKPMMKSESVTSLRQVFDVDAKSKGSNPSLDQIGKRGKTSKEDLGKQKSKEDLGKMESEKSLSEKLEQQKQDAKKSDEEASEHNVIIPIGNIYINEVRELTAISEDNVAPLKSIHAKESMLSDLKNSHLKDLKDSPKSGSQFSFSDMPE